MEFWMHSKQSSLSNPVQSAPFPTALRRFCRKMSKFHHPQITSQNLFHQLHHFPFTPTLGALGVGFVLLPLFDSIFLHNMTMTMMIMIMIHLHTIRKIYSEG